MALIQVRMRRDEEWQPDDRLILLRGPENGGELDDPVEVGARPVGPAPDSAAPIAMDVQHLPVTAGRSPVLSLGVAVEDALGNRSPVFQSFCRLADAPRGPRNLSLAATATPNQALLTFDPSPDVVQEY
jgi:hypothetical protein